ISATLLACNIAAPAACTTRPATSTPSVGASPHPAAATVNSRNPSRYTSFRPAEADTPPTGTSSATNVIRYANDTQDTAANDVWNSCRNAGNVNVTTLASS